MERPTINANDAVVQSGQTIAMYLGQAIDMIDRQFEIGYAKRNPALVAECVRSQTMDFNSVALCCAIYELAGCSMNR